MGKLEIVFTQFFCLINNKFSVSLMKMTLTGEPSIQNGLEMALQTLRMIPAHASREVVMILGSLTTCDPSDISETIQTLKRENIRCSVISLSAETRIMKHLTTETHGIYSTILDETHYRDQLFQHIEPLQATSTQECSLIKMGFPHGIVQTQETNNKKEASMMSLCMCHLDCGSASVAAPSADGKRQLSITGYYCPQCQAKYCELPVECVVCGLTLVLAPHLARSYHHLFPIDNFVEVTNEKTETHCYGCQKLFQESDKNLFQCPKCEKLYCIDCDIFIHDTLHTCIGCSSLPTQQQRNLYNSNNNFDASR